MGYMSGSLPFTDFDGDGTRDGILRQLNVGEGLNGTLINGVLSLEVSGGDANVNNGTITLTAGTNIAGGGNFTTNQLTAEEITFNGLSDADIRALITGTSPISVSAGGAVSIDQTALSITESQISDLQTYLTAETNDLSAAVTWANVPNANITQGSVTQHQAALSITESQISDLQTYLTAETNDLSAAVTWANVPNANITQGSVTQHQGALSITESQISDLQSYLVGVVPVTSGGTGATSAAAARTALGVDASGTDNSTDVTLATVASNYLSISGQVVTAGTVPLSLGGTGATSAAAARTALGVDASGTDNSTDVTLATVASNYLSISGQVVTAGTVPLSLGGTGATTASAARTALGVDASGTDNSTDVTLATVTDNYLSISGQAITAGTVPVALGGTGATTASAARNALGLAIGSDVQAHDAALDDISGLAVTNGNFIVGDGTNWVAESGATARTSLGLGTAAEDDTGDFATAAQGIKADTAHGWGNHASAGYLTSYTETQTLDDVVQNGASTASAIVVGGLTVDTNTVVVDTTNNRLGLGTNSPKTRLTVEGTVTLKEQAAADGDTAAYGQLWVKTGTPNELYFTNDAGTDIRLDSETDSVVGGINGLVKSNGSGTISAAVEDTDYQGVPSEGAFADGDKTKLDGIEASADVTDTANVVGALTAGTNITIAVDGTISATDTDTDTQLSTEQVQDIVGGMLGGTETGITVTYQDATGDIDFVVATQSDENFTTTLKNKLDAIEDNADVTDATNVKSALDGMSLTDIGTPASTDKILIQDTSDSNNLKYADFSEFGGGGGGTPSGVAGAVQFSDGSAFASDDANLHYDDSNNRLGVGTNSPSETLHVKGNVLIEDPTSNGSSDHLLEVKSGSSGTPDNARLLISADTDAKLPMLHLRDVEANSGTFSTHYSAYFALDRASAIITGSAQNDLLIANGNLNKDIHLCTNNAGNGSQAQARLTIVGSDGDVGIGTTSPAQKLHVNGTIRQTGVTSAVLVANSNGDLVAASNLSDRAYYEAQSPLPAGPGAPPGIGNWHAPVAAAFAGWIDIGGYYVPAFQ